jgi:hypothetical protein
MDAITNNNNINEDDLDDDTKREQLLNGETIKWTNEQLGDVNYNVYARKGRYVPPAAVPEYTFGNPQVCRC